MRIGIIASPLVAVPPTQYGGTEQVVYYLIKGLKEAGHEPILFGAGDSTVDCEVVPIVDKALRFPAKKSAFPAFQAKMKQIERKTRRLIKENAYRLDVVHANSFDLSPHSFDLSWLKELPSVTTMHNPIILDELKYYFKRPNLNLISISNNQRKACPSLNYIGTVYNGEDPAMFPQVAEPEDYVCFLGRFDREKNPHLAIELAISYGIKIKLAGKLDLKGEGYFEEEVKKYFNHPLVEYLGELGFDDKVKLLSNAKCNLHPTSFREPFGLTVLEAAYCGTPTLAISRGAMSELIEDGRTGILVEDFVEGYGQLEECFKLDRSYTSTRARALFNYQNMTAGYLEAYEKAIASHIYVPDKPSLNVFKRFLHLVGGETATPELNRATQQVK